jgi:hypothetical protein
VSVTIPVLPSGPDANGQAFLAAARSASTRIDIINVMTMDYYGSYDTGGATMGADAADAAQATLAYAQTLWLGMTYANIGVTPMIGQNDDPPRCSPRRTRRPWSASPPRTTWDGSSSGRWTGTSRAAGRPAACPQRGVAHDSTTSKPPSAE